MLKRLLGRPRPGSEIPEPPRRLVEAIGGGAFQDIGEEFLRHFIQLAGLRSDESVLDIGCGCGRMAVPLTKHLDARGHYEGFDVQCEAIHWCSREITSRFPRFRFHCADVRNNGYNPRGRELASAYRFPYDDRTFDFVFLTSVFTHMLRADMEHYLDEVARVLKPNGRCLITYFLLNEESRGLIAAGESTVEFPYEAANTAVFKRDLPEGAVAYPEEDIDRALEARGLTIDRPISYGVWCGRPDGLSYQDIVIARSMGG